MMRTSRPSMAVSRSLRSRTAEWPPMWRVPYPASWTKSMPCRIGRAGERCAREDEVGCGEDEILRVAALLVEQSVQLYVALLKLLERRVGAEVPVSEARSALQGEPGCAAHPDRDRSVHRLRLEVEVAREVVELPRERGHL